MKINTRIAYDANVDILRPPIQVFGAFTHVPAIPKWQKPVKAIREFSGTPIGLKTNYTLVSIFLAKEYNTEVEIIAFDPPNMVKYDHVGPIYGEMTVTFTEIPGGTRLNLQFEGHTGNFFGITAPLLKTNIQKQTVADLKALKQVLDV
jgi:hypothetical protein